MVIMPWAFKFLLTTDDQLACLRQVRKHLADEGVFILDLYPREATDMPEIEKQTVEIDGATITRTYTYSNDLIAQRGHTNTVVEVVYSDGKTESFEANSIVSLIMSREANLLVRTAGFEIAEEYGGNDFSEYKPEDWKRVLVLKKATDG